MALALPCRSTRAWKAPLARPHPQQWFSPVRCSGSRPPAAIHRNSYFGLGVAGAAWKLARMSSRLPFRCGYASFGTGRAVHSEAAPPAEEPPRIPAIVDLFEMLARERRNLPAMRPELADVLLAKLERVQASDFGIGPDICQQLPPSAAVGYIEVGQTREVTLCVFVLKKGASLPLHDHPGMHVFGRLLFGRMLAVSFDLEPLPHPPAPASPLPPTPEGFPPAPPAAPRRHARVYETEVYGPEPRTYSLSPSAGNLHYLEALEDCCFFDVVTPPYDASQGRDCTYYFAHIDLKLASKGEFCPVEVYQPRGFYTHPLPYKGPRPDWLQALRAPSDWV